MNRQMLQRAGAHLVSAAALLVDLVAENEQARFRWGDGGPHGLIVGALILAHLPAVFRPSRVWTSFLVLCGFGILAGVLTIHFAPFAGLVVTLLRVATRAPTRSALAALALGSVPLGLNAINTTYEVTGVGRPLLLTAPLWAAFGILPWGIGRTSYLASQRAADRERLKEVEAEQQLRAERLRLARELHDIISHSVSAMILQAAGARVTGSSGDPRQLAALEAVEKTGVQAMRELHRLLGLLRSAESDEAADPLLAQETISDLDPLLESVRACDVEVELINDGARRDLDPSVDHAAYRMIQEALANVIKHAGRGATARVHLNWQPDQLKIDIRNTAGLVDDQPRPDLSSGSGLTGLQERIELVGGRFESGLIADGTFLVRAELPLTGLELQGAA